MNNIKNFYETKTHDEIKTAIEKKIFCYSSNNLYPLKYALEKEDVEMTKKIMECPRVKEYYEKNNFDQSSVVYNFCKNNYHILKLFFESEFYDPYRIASLTENFEYISILSKTKDIEVINLIISDKRLTSHNLLEMLKIFVVSDNLLFASILLKNSRIILDQSTLFYFLQQSKSNCMFELLFERKNAPISDTFDIVSSNKNFFNHASYESLQTDKLWLINEILLVPDIFDGNLENMVPTKEQIQNMFTFVIEKEIFYDNVLQKLSSLSHLSTKKYIEKKFYFLNILKNCETIIDEKRRAKYLYFDNFFGLPRELIDLCFENPFFNYNFALCYINNENIDSANIKYIFDNNVMMNKKKNMIRNKFLVNILIDEYDEKFDMQAIIYFSDYCFPTFKKLVEKNIDTLFLKETLVIVIQKLFFSENKKVIESFIFTLEILKYKIHESLLSLLLKKYFHQSFCSKKKQLISILFEKCEYIYKNQKISSISFLLKSRNERMIINLLSMKNYPWKKIYHTLLKKAGSRGLTKVSIFLRKLKEQ